MAIENEQSPPTENMETKDNKEVGVDDVNKVHKALKSERELNRAAKKKTVALEKENESMKEKMERWEGLGESFEKINDLIHRDQPQDAQAILERERKEQQRLVDNFNKQINEKNAIIKEKDKFIENSRKHSAIKHSAEKAGIMQNCLLDVIKLTENRIKIDDNNKLVMLDEEGYLTSKSIDDFFDQDYRKQRPEYFQAKSATGSGLLQNRGRQGGKQFASRAKMTLTEKSDFIKEYGKTAFFDLPR